MCLIVTTNVMESLKTIQEGLKENEDDNESSEDEKEKGEKTLKYYLINRTGYPIRIFVPLKGLEFY